MKASEIVEKFKNVLLNADEEQVQPQMEMKEESDIEVKEEEVVLSEQKEEVKESEETTELSEEVEAGYGNKDGKEMEEMPKPKESDFVTKEELAKAIAEVKAMVSKLSQEEEALEVPQELEAEEKQELSAQEPEVEPIKHSPESEVGKKQEFLYAQKRNMSTRDIVFNKISNF